MADFISHENRVRLFLAFLIIVLVIVNSQSLHFSHTSRKTLTTAFDAAARSKAELMASRLATVLAPAGSPAAADRFQRSARLSEFLQALAEEHSAASACLLDWNGRILAGSSDCRLSDVLDFDRLDRVGKYRLVDRGWTMTEVSPAYQPESATAFGYLALRYPDGTARGVLRVQFPASSLAEVNRSFRSTLVYQVSALSLVLLTLVLFLNSLLAPHRRLVAEARSVAGDSAVTSAAEDEGQFLLSTFRDVVAKLKEKEKQLAEMHRMEKARADETEALATDIIQSMTTGLVSLDEAGRVVLVNPAAERIFGADAQSFQGKSFREALPGSQVLVGWMARALGEGSQSLRRRVDYQCQSGESIHLGTSVLPLPSTEGKVRGALCLFADLTEVMELRERLFIKDNLASLGEMAAGIAHEFRNSLATILGNAKLLRQSVSSEEHDTVVDALVEECSSLSRVVTEFLQFARPETVRAVPFDMAEMARDLSRDLEPQVRAAKVQLTLEAQSFLVEADEMLLRKAVSNLMLNAIEAAAAKDSGEAGEVHLETGGHNGLAFVRVSDNGPGILGKDLPRIFSPFFITKSEGTGLGLSIVQKIVVSHNGEVEVKSKPGDGTTFVLSLPARPESGTTTEGEWI